MKVLVIIPAYNEELNIKKVVSNLIDHYPQYNYVVVNDGSADSTSQICHQEGYNIIDLPVNLGLAGAFQTGLKYADQEGYDCAIQFDADGQHRPEYIEDLLKEIENGYDIVIGSRFVTEKKPFSMRMLGNRMIERAIKFSTGKVLTDPTSGMRMYSKKIIHEFASNINYGPEPDTISFMIKQGASVKDVQVKMDERTAGERERLGLNDPVLVQYGRWLGKVLHGDFGTSYSNGKPVAELLSVRLLPTLKLAFSALILMLLVAVPLGMLSAVYKNTWVDYLVRGVTFLGVSIPNFWVGLILLYVVALKFSLLPVISTGDGFEKIILPAITLAFAMAGKYTRQVRTAVLEELNKDYVTGARARGMSEQEILWKQVFPNALLPLITLLGLSLGNLLGGTAVVEVIFTYPGLGNLAVQAITAYDYSLIQGYVLWVALIYMVINLLVDMSYTFVDPRIRRNERG